MRNALVCTAMLLVASRAFADEPGQVPPAPAPAAPAAPAAPPQPQPPPPEPPATTTPEPKADPAYGDRPDGAPGDSGPTSFAAPRGHDYFIKSYPDRTTKNIATLSVTAGVAVVLGGIGLYFHLDSRDRANEVNAHKFTGQPWTQDRQATFDDAHSSAVTAGVFYGIGGALLLGTAIAYMVTEPKQETVLIHPHTDPKPTALVAPLHGGALVGGTWSF